MQWEGRQESSNVEDRRGMGGLSTGAVVGGGGSILLVVLALLFGVNPRDLMNQRGGGGPDPEAARAPDADEDRMAGSPRPSSTTPRRCGTSSSAGWARCTRSRSWSCSPTR